jgi:hypothetical protein
MGFTKIDTTHIGMINMIARARWVVIVNFHAIIGPVDMMWALQGTMHSTVGDCWRRNFPMAVHLAIVVRGKDLKNMMHE